jgi:hypothetical protein
MLPASCLGILRPPTASSPGSFFASFVDSFLLGRSPSFRLSFFLCLHVSYYAVVPICSHTLLAKQGSNAQFLVTLFWYLIMLLSDCFFCFQLKTYFERASNNNFFHNTNIRRACKHYSTFWLLTSKFNMLCILCVYIYLYTYLYTYHMNI